MLCPEALTKELSMDIEKKILIVDDDAGIGEMLKTLLEFSGYKVMVTENPHHTGDLLLQNGVDLVLLDMLIDGVNGTDICVELKQDKRTAGVPVLMMSALHEAGAKCTEAGADDFIAKPFEMEDLLDKINRILEKQQHTS